MAKIGKMKYILGSINNDNVVIEEVKNKWGKLYSANRMMATCRVKSILHQLASQNIKVSYGKVLSLHPFFITYAKEKEIVFCLCKLCLNTRILFEPLMAQAKRDNDEITGSLTESFMSSRECLKSQNGYYQWDCISLKCKSCKNIKPMLLKFQTSKMKTKVYQFTVTKKPYKDGEIVEKVSQKT